MQTMDFAKSIAKYAPIGRQYFELIPQRSIQISLFPKECTYNAIWDYNVSPEGRHYFPLCAENSVSGFVRLYEYLPDTGEFKLCFNLEDVVVTYPRNVRASKIHTSIDFLPDGRLIMTTHTTAAAPTHPYWLFFGYYSHPWEGYSGSNVLIYDPKTGKVEDLGIPVQRDSIYGACYDKTRNALYFNSYLRGHSYRMDLDNRHVTDYGQTTIQGSFYLKHGRDGNIYTTTRDGYFFRFNTQKQNLEDLGIQIPYGRSLNCNMMPHAADGPDGRMYVFNLTNAYLHTYDYDNNTLESMGCIVPDELWDDGWCYMHGGCGFDKYGVLWYVLSIRAEEENYLTLPHLCSLNVAKSGAKPRDMGAIGTREVVGRSCSEAHIYGDTFFMTFTNHGNDAPGMIRIDLEAIREDCDQPRIVGNDPYLYIGFSNGFDLYNGNLFTDGQPCYDSIAKSKEFGEFRNNNPYIFKSKNSYVTQAWREIGFGVCSAVRDVSFDTDSNVLAICDNVGTYTRLTICEGKILKRENNFLWIHPDPETVAAQFAHCELPAQPGRQYIAKAEAYCTMADGKQLVGTCDGMLALVDGNSVYSLGAVCAGGGIHALTVNSSGILAYGVAGDMSDLGMVFSYDAKRGLKLYGYINSFDASTIVGTGCSYEPCCIKFAPDDRSIVIGARDRMGCVYQFYLDE